MERENAKLYFSGKIKNRVTGDFELEVDRVRIKIWRRGQDDKLVLICMCEGRVVEYAVESTSKAYRKALGTLCFSAFSSTTFQQQQPIDMMK